MTHTWLARLYAALLLLYPPGFRAEFGEEMQSIFAQAADEASQRGANAFARLCLGELAGLPAALLRAHGQALNRRTAADTLSIRPNPLESSWRELLLALAVFLLPAVLALINGSALPTSLGLPAAGIFLVVMILIGWLGGFPLWSLPYVGLVLAIAAYLHLFQWVAGLVRPALINNFSPGPLDRSTYLLLEVASNGMLWLMLFCLTLLVVALLAVFNRFQPLLARVRHDWSQLSYVLYGESVFALLVLFGSHRSDPNYTIASLLCLLAGVWFYLRSPSRSLRLLALVTCLTLAVAIAVLEKSPPLMASGEGLWIVLGSGEAGRLLLTWAAMMAALLLPGLLSRPVSRGTRPAAGGLPSG
jgi:hypothetical protein